MNRRQALAAFAALGFLPDLVRADASTPVSLIGAAWRGPKPDAPYFAGILAADWAAEKLSIRYAVPLPTRPHGIVAEAGGGLLVLGVRPGTWLLRCDGDGRVIRHENLDGSTTRLGGHAIAIGDRLYTTETDVRTGHGKVGVRDLITLAKLDEWDTHGIDPHQLVADGQGRLLVANGGISRTIPGDRKHNLERMASSLVRLDGNDGRLTDQWRLDDPRLSLRHLAWSHDPARGDAWLGVALQAEHDDPAARATAPLLAVLDRGILSLPTRANDGIGYAGDIASAAGGFVLSSNQAGLALFWHPGARDRLAPVVKLKESYALASWPGPGGDRGLLLATALGLVRWQAAGTARFLPWPEPMALDNHWVLAG